MIWGRAGRHYAGYNVVAQSDGPVVEHEPIAPIMALPNHQGALNVFSHISGLKTADASLANAGIHHHAALMGFRDDLEALANSRGPIGMMKLTLFFPIKKC